MKTVLNPLKIPVQDRIMFLGPDQGIQRYDQFKYPIFFDLYEKQESFRWLPKGKIDSKDRIDYEKLTDAELHVFNTNIRWQTMTDSMLSRSIHELGKYVTNPELEICMGIWAHMKNIHSLSYTEIFKAVTKDATDFFDSITDDPIIVGRSNELAKAYDSFFGEPTDIKQQIFDAVLNTQGVEGVSFYTSFLCSFWFGYRGKMEGNTKIISEIARDENLHQAITMNIFKNWKNNPEEGFQELLKKNVDKIYEFYKLLRKQNKEWAGYLFSKGSLLGLNEEILGNWVEWMIDRRLVSMGYKKLYNTPNPAAGWSDSFFDSSLVQEAPQEVSIAKYRIGSNNEDLTDVNWDEFKF